jgi:hypothetical protein
MAPYALKLLEKIMAPHISSNATPGAILGKIPVPCHSYDDWLMPSARNDKDAQFASTVIDVARGARAIASIMAQHLVDLNAIAGGAGESVRPLLSETDMECLARLAVFSLDQLQEIASNQVDRFNTLAEKGGRA